MLACPSMHQWLIIVATMLACQSMHHYNKSLHHYNQSMHHCIPCMHYYNHGYSYEPCLPVKAYTIPLPLHHTTIITSCTLIITPCLPVKACTRSAHPCPLGLLTCTATLLPPSTWTDQRRTETNSYLCKQAHTHGNEFRRPHHRDAESRYDATSAHAEALQRALRQERSRADALAAQLAAAEAAQARGSSSSSRSTYAQRYSSIGRTLQGPSFHPASHEGTVALSGLGPCSFPLQSASGVPFEFGANERDAQIVQHQEQQPRFDFLKKRARQQVRG